VPLAAAERARRTDLKDYHGFKTVNRKS
jgi:hypothetical protein